MITAQPTHEPLPLGKQKKSFDILGFLKRYGLFIILLGGFLFAMLTPLIFLVKKPYYEVHALMRVDPTIPSLLENNDRSSIVSYYDRYANTVAQSMTTPEILSKALEAMDPETRERFMPKGIPIRVCIAILQNRIVVEPVFRSHLVDLKISGEKGDGLAEFLNTLMKVYIEDSWENSNSSNADRLKFLYAQKNIVSGELSSIERDLDSLTQDIGTSSFSESFNIAGKQNELIGENYNKALNDRITTEANLNTLIKAQGSLGKIVLDAEMEEIVLGNAGLNLTENWTNQELQLMRRQTDGLTAINPERISVEEQMKSMNVYAEKLRERVKGKASLIVLGKRDIGMQRNLIDAKQKFEAATARTDSLHKIMQANQSESRRISIGIHRGEFLSAQWKNKFEMLRDIEKRITEVEVEKKAPLRISVFSSATSPGGPLKSNINKITLLLLIGSFSIAGGIFGLYEYFDDTIRSSKDIKHGLGYPPVQVIGNLRKGNAKDQEQFSLAPEDFRAHQIGSLAVKFLREKEKTGAKTILFTGTDEGVGASSITVSCAKALSQLAPKILIIDAAIEGSPVEGDDEFQICLPGLCDYLAGTTELTDSIISTPGDNIDMMYAGNITGNTIPRQKIPQLITELKETYDFICIDAPPLLHSHLTEQLALHADITTLIALGDSSKFREFRKSAELLVKLNVPGIAPILNFGGIRKTLSIVEIFDNPPELMKRLLPEKAIELARRSSIGLRLIDRLLDFSQKLQQTRG